MQTARAWDLNIIPLGVEKGGACDILGPPAALNRHPLQLACPTHPAQTTILRMS